MYRTEPKEKAGVSKSLLQALAQSKKDEMTSRSLIAALEGTAMEEAVSFEDQFKLPDLVSTEGGDQALQQEKDLLKPPQWPVSRPQKYIRMHFNKEKIKIGAAIQREEQRKRAEDALQLRGNIEEDLTQEEVGENTRKEQLKKERAETYTRRVREREEEEEEETEKIEDIVKSGMQSKESSKTKESKKPRGNTGKAEVVQEQLNEEEEEYKEREEGALRKRKIGCINPREVEEFQGFIKTRMEDLVNEMKSNKDLINPVQKFIRALKVQYDVTRLFENNGTANTEDIMSTIPDTKGIVW